jgi:hypothetical protein
MDRHMVNPCQIREDMKIRVLGSLFIRATEESAADSTEWYLEPFTEFVWLFHTQTYVNNDSAGSESLG